MDAHRRLAQLFTEAVALGPEERAAFVAARCRDAQERSQLEALLRADAADGVLPLDESGGTPDAALQGALAEALGDALSAAGVPVTGSASLPGEIGPYSVLRELGSGSMGRVLLARQQSTGQLVALKLLRPGLTLTTPEALARFRRETRILGRLSHPGIARILDAGSARVGGHEQPYIAVEYVQGRHLSDYVREKNAGLSRRLELLTQLCDALQHAHDLGIVHRDLKPENVIVTGDGQAKVLDFGVAHVTGPETQWTAARTADGQVIGTLAYMSPEQASGSARDLDARSDVYALGVIGYELVSGRRPYALEDLDLVAAARVIHDRDPEPLRNVAPAVPRDVATILGKALAKEPRERYPTAAALAEDLRHFARNEPIVARAATGLYVLRKLARRHRGLTAGLIATLITLVVGTVVALVLAARAMRASETARWQTYLATVAAASSEVHTGARERALEHLQRAPEEHRGFEWRALRNLADRSTRRLTGHGYNVWNVAVSPDGSRAYSCAGDATVRVWDIASGTELAALAAHGQRVFSVAASPDGQYFASGAADRTVRLWDATTLREVALLEGHDEGAFGLAFSRDGRTLAVGANDGDLRLWNVDTRELERVLQDRGARVWSIAFSHDDATLVVAFDDGTLGVFDRRDGRRRATLETDGERAVDVSFHPDGKRFAVATTSGELQLWDLASGERLASVAAHGTELGCVEVAPDGLTIVTGARDGTLSVWCAERLEKATDLPGHSDWVQSLAFDEQGDVLVSGSWDDSVRVWDGATLRECLAPSAEPVRGEVHEDPAEPGTLLVEGEAGLYRRPVFGSRLWPQRGPNAASDPVARRPSGERIGPGGRVSARTSDGRDAVALVDVATGTVRHRIAAPADTIEALGFDASGQHLLTRGDRDCSVRVWDVETGAEVAVLRGHVNAVSRAVADPAGELVATCSVDRTCILWSTADFSRVGVLAGHGTAVTASAFSPDRTRIATSTDDGRLRLWDRSSLEEVAVLDVADSAIEQLAFSHAGDGLVVRTSAGDLIVVDARAR